MDPIDALESGQVKRFFRARQKLNAPGVISHITQRASGLTGCSKKKMIVWRCWRD